MTRFLIVVVVITVICLLVDSTQSSANLLNCSKETSFNRVLDYNESFRSTVTLMTSGENTLYYILTEQDQNLRNITRSLIAYDLQSKQRVYISQVNNQLARLNAISNVVTDQNNSSMGDLKVIQLFPTPPGSNFRAKLQILTINNLKITEEYIYEDNSTEPVYDTSGNIVKYESTNNTVVFASTYNPFPIVTNVLGRYTYALIQSMTSLKFVRISGNQVHSTLIIPKALAIHRDMYSNGYMKTDLKSGQTYIFTSLFKGYGKAFLNYHNLNSSLLYFPGDDYSSIDILIKIDHNAKIIGVQQVGLPFDLDLKFVSINDVEIEWTEKGNNLHVVGRVLKGNDIYSAMYYKILDVDSSFNHPMKTPDVYQIYDIAAKGKSSQASSILVNTNAIYIAGDTNYVQVQTGSVVEPAESILFVIDSKGHLQAQRVWSLVKGRDDTAYNLVVAAGNIYFATSYDGPITHSTDGHSKAAIFELKCSEQRPRKHHILLICITVALLVMMGVMFLSALTVLCCSRGRKQEYDYLQ